ncbi:MAG: GGDEF domain-containing protein [Lachnospiraceae bacterium]|nr:GGDEF domain-containing protein [Lachnospiraceae bacterium]
MEYSIEKVRQFTGDLSYVFDIVRLVDPINCKIISFNNQGEVIFDEHKCYQVWNKNTRCENCISVKAFNSNKRLTKFEFVYKEIYHVISKPIQIKTFGNSDYPLVIEMVNKITDEVLFEAFGKDEFINKIIIQEKKVYEDSLTKVYNRRYFDERIFCHNSRCNLEGEVVFIMADLKNFKGINDTYGHHIGDLVLVQSAQTMKDCIRSCDSVIRMGGDEFLIILKNCKYKMAEKIVSSIKEKMANDVVYDEKLGKYAVGNFGISHSASFKCTDEDIDSMISEADKNMYLDKSQRK